MKALSIDNINKKSSYIVREATEKGFFEFFTDSNVHYSVGFMLDEETLRLKDCYELIIANVNNQKSPNDAKLRDTVIAIVDEFFRTNNSTMLYICETGDGKQAMRNRLFQFWFSTYCKKNAFTFMSSSIEDDGVINYATLVVRNDNPNLSNIINAFTSTIQLLSSKPEWN